MKIAEKQGLQVVFFLENGFNDSYKMCSCIVKHQIFRDDTFSTLLGFATF